MDYPPTLLYSNGESYVGSVDAENKRHGSGLLVRADRSLLSGIWAHDELIEELNDTKGTRMFDMRLEHTRAENLVVTEKQCCANILQH